VTHSSSVNFNNKELNEGIAGFYDASSGLWEDMWGEHMHHGFYDPDLPLFAALSADHRAAQIRMIEESLRWASVPGNIRFFSSAYRLSLISSSGFDCQGKQRV
jgi:tocopherol O-methyltransferase